MNKSGGGGPQVVQMGVWGWGWGWGWVPYDLSHGDLTLPNPPHGQTHTHTLNTGSSITNTGKTHECCKILEQPRSVDAEIYGQLHFTTE